MKCSTCDGTGWKNIFIKYPDGKGRVEIVKDVVKCDCQK
jgi:hypothetical protein